MRGHGFGAVWASLLWLLSCWPAVQAADEAGTSPARLIVRYREPAAASAAAGSAQDEPARAAPSARAAQLSALSGRPLKFLRRLGTGALLVDAGSGMGAADLERLAERIRRSAPAELLSVEPDRVHQAVAVPNDPYLASEWGLAGPAQANGLAGINAYSAWDTGSGAGAVVAVIDTGYRPHADLASQVVAQYDFISDTTSANDGNGRDADAQDPGDWRTPGLCGASASNSSWHGTHVAGTVAAVTDNAIGVAGAAYGARLVIARVLGRCGGMTSDISDAIVWASGGTVSGVPANAQPAQVLNLSLGGAYPCSSSPQMQAAIDSARSRNTTVVVAAGNSNTDAASFSPASCSGVIAVASVGPTGARAYYSNYGSVVDIAAPGGDTSMGSSAGILSTYNSGATTPGSDSYAYLQGTSMASPHVAGVAALLYGLNASLTPDAVESAIENNARAFPSGCSGCGSGLVDATLALASITPGPGALSFGSAAYSVAENAGSATITVQRTGGLGAVSVAYATANGSALAGSDYTASSGTLSWADGDTAAKSFSVPVTDDSAAESTETIALALSSPGGGASLGAVRNATLSIGDNDSAPGTLALSSAAYTVAETGGAVTITVTRTGGSNGSASVVYGTANSSATAGSDYTAKSGTLTWASRDTASKTFTVAISNDTLAEANETLQVRLSSATGASLGSPSTATVTINDDDTVPSAGSIGFVSASASVAETGGMATISVRRSSGTVGAVSVAYSSSNGSATAGSDYTAVSGTLSWADGDAANKSFSVPISDDLSVEASETVVLTLASPTGGAALGTRTATLSIGDNDGTPGTLALSSASYGVAETGGAVTITVTRSGGSTGAASVAYTTANGSAFAGSDFTARSGTLMWNSGDAASKSFTVAIANDTLSEAAETFQIRLSGVSGAALGLATGTVTIADDDTPSPAGTLSFSTAAVSVAETGGSATITVRRLNGSLGAVTVAYATSNGSALAGSDYTASSGTLSWADGDAANKTFTVPIADDLASEANETIALALSGATGGAVLGTRAATLTITDNDSLPGVLALSSATYTVSESGGVVTVTVTRTGGASGAASVNYSTANGSAFAGSDFTARSGTLMWNSNDAASKSFTIPIANDTLTEAAETLQVRLTAAVTAVLGTPATATVTITDND